ncbi:hypothetical protein EIN_412350 [Entamoeba invadens IP1]|uniref:Uncharacterized protein n=1 Tax=Entamoeba invadens IP1 TaxID=370355 RepID=A0A0A1UFM0_ENTIV|nr:hypothetical protein EIN_412350 [Entamoeba invadens IP1]ELP95366.1 hypothetical protein EIN_412350 [Entamoeba invadens IP1]|eukprot:XP_004262137.1 hypothetical protein EIN_412350 [Entamoeba invadens IP1]
MRGKLFTCTLKGGASVLMLEKAQTKVPNYPNIFDQRFIDAIKEMLELLIKLNKFAKESYDRMRFDGDAVREVANFVVQAFGTEGNLWYLLNRLFAKLNALEHSELPQQEKSELQLQLYLTPSLFDALFNIFRKLAKRKEYRHEVIVRQAADLLKPYSDKIKADEKLFKNTFGITENKQKELEPGYYEQVAGATMVGHVQEYFL